MQPEGSITRQIIKWHIARRMQFLWRRHQEHPDGSADLSYIAAVAKQIAESIEKECQSERMIRCTDVLREAASLENIPVFIRARC